jgi:hypothetical protein
VQDGPFQLHQSHGHAAPQVASRKSREVFSLAGSEKISIIVYGPLMLLVSIFNLAVLIGAKAFREPPADILILANLFAVVKILVIFITMSTPPGIQSTMTSTRSTLSPTTTNPSAQGQASWGRWPKWPKASTQSSSASTTLEKSATPSKVAIERCSLDGSQPRNPLRLRFVSHSHHTWSLPGQGTRPHTLRLLRSKIQSSLSLHRRRCLNRLYLNSDNRFNRLPEVHKEDRE